MKKKNRPRKPVKRIEREYQQLFTPHPLPFQGINTDADNLEQPSMLKYFDSTTTPVIELAVEPQMK
jgi:hypothetical protein